MRRRSMAMFQDRRFSVERHVHYGYDDIYAYLR